MKTHLDAISSGFGGASVIRVIKRKLLVLLVFALATAGTAVEPSHAYFAAEPSGYAGPWLGSSPGFVYCAGAYRYIRAPGPYIGRATAYPTSDQTIWMQVRLERYNGGTGLWEMLQWKPWAWQTVRPSSTGYAAFWETTFNNIGPVGYYRVSYDFRWSVAGKTIGSIFGFHSGSEYQVTTSTGFTFNHGCYI